jgi:MoaA/NifB/PqqE/SkfB family radical SAM enzyme
MKTKTFLSSLQKRYFNNNILNNILNEYEETPFSSKQFYFFPKTNDWIIIRKKVSTINLYITKRCNSFCKLCFMNSSPIVSTKFDLSIDEIKQILNKIGKRKRIVLMGGEPTIREDLFEIIKIIRKSGNYPILYTNGLKLADINYVKKLKKYGLCQVIITFDGFDSKVTETLRGSRGEYFLKLMALKNLEAERILTFISMTVAKGINEKEIRNVIKYAINSVKRKGVVRHIMMYGATITKYGRYMLPKETYMKTDELLRELTKINRDIKISYFLEFKKLLIKIYNLSNKIGYPIPLASGGLIAFYRIGSLKELIPLKELKKINKIWNKNKVLAIIKTISKIGLINVIKMIIDPFKYLLNSNVLLISLGNVNNEYNFKPINSGCIGIEKNNKTNKIMIQSFNFGTYYPEGNQAEIA